MHVEDSVQPESDDASIRFDELVRHLRERRRRSYEGGARDEELRGWR